MKNLKTYVSVYPMCDKEERRFCAAFFLLIVF